jgi:hypothetical protein
MKRSSDISDELLASYLDGNTSEAETRKVLEALEVDQELREIVEIALQIENDRITSYDVLPMMKLAAESGNNVCSVLCEAFVLHKRGVPFEEKELLVIAQQNHWLTPQGTPLHSIGQLLAHYGLMVTRRYDATMYDVSKALALDNDVMVVVDSDKLYPEREDVEDAPNHAVVVMEIDGDSKTVTIFDPQENAQMAIPTPQFELAWNESQNYMVRVLQLIEDYDPQPINLESIQLTDDLLELREAIAENAHEVWAATRIKEGWSYGQQRDDANKKHPDLVPYSALPDSEKEYDRIMAMDTIKLVRKLGYDLMKRKD